MTRSERSVASSATTAIIAAVMLLSAPAPLRAGPAMSTANNKISRDVDNGGGAYSSTANNQMTGSAAEEVALTTSSTANNLLRSGFATIMSYPGTIASLTTNGGVSTSSTTLNWPTPGYDGNQGVALGGSAYLVQIASNVTYGNLSNLSVVTVSISTSAQALAKIVGSGVTGLDPNTTYYAQVMLRDNDGDVGGPFTTALATFTTLANPPVVGALEFTSIQWSSVAVAWIAPSELSVSSKSNEGYTLLASSNNFGALAPAGAPVISSTTFQALASTLTVGAGGIPLDLSSTYYFQVGSLNWAGQANYATFSRLNFQIVRSTGLVDIHNIDLTVAKSTVATSSMVVTNVGNWPATILLAASTVTAPSSYWSLGTSSGVEQAALQGVWYTGALGPPAVGPPPSTFTTFLTTSPVISQASGNYSSASQNGFQLAPGANITMWFRFFFPTSTSSPGHETLQVTAQPVYP